ncbi:hypothetical protein HHK36_001386 [Tetracentron sinense]|uniref:MPN domain-containing protein n=1 Tax=Tetracentron sinense TaxID=13715 RepID=A0A835DUQ7_TETSI|nr:hypothetical protein HHK36_001386 [Tetracentron sinense]
MGGEVRYEIGQNAYIKLILHSLKHKTSAVNGVLLGRLVNDDVVEISETVPLSHSQIGLLPTLEIALIQIEEHFGVQGMNLVGYYHANERFDDFELGNIAKNIGDNICRYFPQAAVLLLDNRKLEALPKGKDRNPVVQRRAALSSSDLSLVVSPPMIPGFRRVIGIRRPCSPIIFPGVPATPLSSPFHRFAVEEANHRRSLTSDLHRRTYPAFHDLFSLLSADRLLRRAQFQRVTDLFTLLSSSFSPIITGYFPASAAHRFLPSSLSRSSRSDPDRRNLFAAVTPISGSSISSGESSADLIARSAPAFVDQTSGSFFLINHRSFSLVFFSLR